MKALVLPRGKSAAELQDWPLPPAAEAAQTMLRTLEVGVCGTDRLLLEGIEGMPPQGENALVLGHEGLFEVVSSSAGQALNPGISSSPPSAGRTRGPARSAPRTDPTCA